MNIQNIFENHTLYSQPELIFNTPQDVQSCDLISGRVDADVVVFFVLNQSESTKDELKTMVFNMMKAVKIEAEDVLMVNVLKSISFSNIKSIVNFKKAIIFGVGNLSMGWQIETVPYTLFNFSGVEILIAEDLEQISKDKQKKVVLWQFLQQLFQLK
jgi:DNA polymerase III psi subunit